MPVLDKNDTVIADPPAAVTPAGVCFSCSFEIDAEGNYAVAGVQAPTPGVNNYPLVCDATTNGVRAELSAYTTCADLLASGLRPSFAEPFVAQITPQVVFLPGGATGSTTVQAFTPVNLNNNERGRITIHSGIFATNSNIPTGGAFRANFQYTYDGGGTWFNVTGAGQLNLRWPQQGSSEAHSTWSAWSPPLPQGIHTFGYRLVVGGGSAIPDGELQISTSNMVVDNLRMTCGTV